VCRATGLRFDQTRRFHLAESDLKRCFLQGLLHFGRIFHWKIAMGWSLLMTMRSGDVPQSPNLAARLVAWGVVSVLVLLPFSLLAVSLSHPCVCTSEVSIDSCCAVQAEALSFEFCSIDDMMACCAVSTDPQPEAERAVPSSSTPGNPCPFCLACPVCMPFSPVLVSMLPPQKASVTPPSVKQLTFVSSVDSPSDGAVRLIERPPIRRVA
jgi:hypothetical protein